MILKATNYVSSTGGVFNEMFIEEESTKVIKAKKYLLINFEMYYFLNGVKTIHCERAIAFYGMTGDEKTSNVKAIISIPNPDYDSLIAAIPVTIQIPSQPEFISIENPEYDEENPVGEPMITIPNPDYNPEDLVTVPNSNYDNMVSSVSETISIPLLQYLYENEGNMPESYEVVEWGYPNFEDALTYFGGGDGRNPEITIEQPFARDWFKDTLVMDNQKIGAQFEFIG